MGGTHTSSFAYNAVGHLTTVTISDGDPRSIAYKTDENGQILERMETGSDAPGNVRDIYTRFGAAELGRIGNHGTLNTDYKKSLVNRTNGEADQGFQFGATQATTFEGDFSQGNQQINSFTAQATNSAYTVRSGDTLYSIASAVWGDGNLWYKIAQANGLQGNEPLAAGRQIHLPHNVTRSSFHASTFKAYDPSGALGDTSPTTPVPPKQSNKCGTFGIILMVAIAVAVAAIAGPAIIGTAATASTGATGLTAAFAGTTAAGATAAAAGSAAAIGAGIVGGAIAGAAGSIVSQGFGVATGLQDKFSFKGVALAALAGGVGGGLGGVIKGSGFVAGAGRGAAGSAISQGVGVATGLQDKFSFAGVAAAAIGGGIISELGSHLGLASFSDPSGLSAGNIAGHALAGAAGAIANAATRSALTGTSFGDNVMRALPDTIGSTIGNVIAGAVSGGGTGSSARPHVSGIETAAAGGSADLVPPNAPRGEVRYGKPPRTPEEARSYASSWKPFLNDPLYRDVAPQWIAFYEDAALKLSPVAPETSVVTEYGNSTVGYVDYTDQIASQGVQLGSLSSVAPIFDIGHWNNSAPQRYMMGDGSTIFATSGQASLISQNRSSIAYLDTVRSSTAAGLGYAISNAMGASTSTQNGFYSLGQSFDLAGAGLLTGARVGRVTLPARQHVAPLERTIWPGRPSEPYDRRAHYGYTPSRADRNYFGAKPNEVIDHSPPLVQRYHRGDQAINEKPGFLMSAVERRVSGADRDRMARQLKSESQLQAAEMSRYSRTQNKRNGF